MEGVLILRLLQYLRSLGFDSKDVWVGDDKRLRAIKLNVGLATQEELERVWSNAVRVTNIPHLGLNVGESIGFETLGLLGMIMRNSSTIGELVDQGVKFLKFVTGVVELGLQKSDAHFQLEILAITDQEKKYPNSVEQGCLVTLSFCFHMFLQLTNQVLEVNEVVMPIAYEKYKEDIHERIGGNISFAPVDEIIIKGDNAILDYPIVSADKGIFSLLLSYANKRFIKKTEVWSKRVEYELVNNLQGISLGIVDVAKRFNISDRTLQRKLNEEGVTFSEIKDRVRIEFARQGQLDKKNAKTLAFDLGFSSSSSFSRFISKKGKKKK